ncbi:MAG: hypothetical protein LBJ00_06150 [Planctomycetaceae bacterium]|nr:hypothetical protein [Planctomycetaceae bacterium]
MAQEFKLDSKLINDIVQGHKFLEQSLESLTGKITRESSIGKITRLDNTPNQTLPSVTQKDFLFYNDKNLLRLEYIAPREGAQVLPDHKGNNITDVIICTPDYDFRYLAIATTGVPYANLFKSKSPDESLRMMVQSDYYETINSLSSFPSVKVTDLLQREIGKIEKCKYDKVSNALLIEGKEDISKKGVSSWKIILNPEEHYALMYHEIVVNDKSTNFSLITSGKVTSQKIANKIFPQKITTETQINNQVNNKIDEHKMIGRVEIEITSTNKPDGFLFIENSFKELGRDYVIVNVAADQKQKDGVFVDAAPLAARMPNYAIDDITSAPYWSWHRIILIAFGTILMIIACIRVLLKRKKIL